MYIVSIIRNKLSTVNCFDVATTSQQIHLALHNVSTLHFMFMSA